MRLARELFRKLRASEGSSSASEFSQSPASSRLSTSRIELARAELAVLLSLEEPGDGAEARVEVVPEELYAVAVPRFADARFFQRRVLGIRPLRN